MMLPIIETLLPIVNKVLDLIPDPNAKQKAQMEMQAALLEMSAKQAEQQSKINEVEAQHSSLFVAGWRTCHSRPAVAYRYHTKP